MSIYTKTGDKGITSLADGRRVLKSDPIIEAYGSVDELISFLGLLIYKLKDQEIQEFLTTIQKNLQEIIAVLAGNKKDLGHLEIIINKFEQKINNMQSELSELNGFILPKGTEISLWFHILRTICRRSERNIVRVKNDFSVKTVNIIIKYFNRLSDLFFVLSRWYNREEEVMI